MPICPNCDSENLTITEQYDDGNDFVDCEIKCNNCYKTFWFTFDKDDLDSDTEVSYD